MHISEGMENAKRTGVSPAAPTVVVEISLVGEGLAPPAVFCGTKENAPRGLHLIRLVFTRHLPLKGKAFIRRSFIHSSGLRSCCGLERRGVREVAPYGRG